MLWLLLLSITALTVAGCGSGRQEEKKKAPSIKKPPTDSSTKTTQSSKVHGKNSSKSTRSNKPNQSSKTAKSKKSSKNGKKNSSSNSKKTKSASKSAESSKESAPLSTLLQAVEIHAHPAELSFASIGGLQTFKFVNETNQRRVFKVKCSDNQLYRVNPVFGMVEPKGQVNIDVLRQNGSVKVDKLVLVTVPMPADVNKSPKEILAETKNSQMTVVPLLVDA